MSKETRGDLTIIRHEQTDETVSVYRGDTHLGLIYPTLGFAAVPTDAAWPELPHADENSAIAYLSGAKVQP